MDGFITRVWTFQQKLDWYASENREQALRTMHASMTKRMSHAMLQSMQTIGRNWDMELPTKMRDLQQSERCAPTPSMQLQVQKADLKAMKWTLHLLRIKSPDSEPSHYVPIESLALALQLITIRQKKKGTESFRNQSISERLEMGRWNR